MGSEERLLTFAQPFAEFALLSQYEEYSPVKGPLDINKADPFLFWKPFSFLLWMGCVFLYPFGGSTYKALSKP